MDWLIAKIQNAAMTLFVKKVNSVIQFPNQLIYSWESNLHHLQHHSLNAWNSSLKTKDYKATCNELDSTKGVCLKYNNTLIWCLCMSSVFYNCQLTVLQQVLTIQRKYHSANMHIIIAYNTLKCYLEILCIVQCGWW